MKYNRAETKAHFNEFTNDGIWKNVMKELKRNDFDKTDLPGTKG